MELIATNADGDTVTFTDVRSAEREDGDLMVETRLGKHATKWHRVPDGIVERVRPLSEEE